jgi:hypothetical protein
VVLRVEGRSRKGWAFLAILKVQGSKVSAFDYSFGATASKHNEDGQVPEKSKVPNGDGAHSTFAEVTEDEGVTRPTNSLSISDIRIKVSNSKKSKWFLGRLGRSETGGTPVLQIREIR